VTVEDSRLAAEALELPSLGVLMHFGIYDESPGANSLPDPAISKIKSWFNNEAGVREAMTVIVTRMPGGIAQMFTPETGKITYKCKGETTYMEIEAFGGIVKFNQRGSKAIVSGPVTELLDCEVIMPGDGGYSGAKRAATDAAIAFKEEQAARLRKEIEELG